GLRDLWPVACGLWPRSAAQHVELEAVGLDQELVEVRVVDQPQDFLDVFVAQRHYCFFSAPKVLIKSDIAEAGCAFSSDSGFATPATGLDWTTNRLSGNSTSRASAHSMSWREPK